MLVSATDVVSLKGAGVSIGFNESYSCWCLLQVLVNLTDAGFCYRCWCFLEVLMFPPTGGSILYRRLCFLWRWFLPWLMVLPQMLVSSMGACLSSYNCYRLLQVLVHPSGAGVPLYSSMCLLQVKVPFKYVDVCDRSWCLLQMLVFAKGVGFCYR